MVYFLSALESLPVLLDKQEELSSSFGGMSNFPIYLKRSPFGHNMSVLPLNPFPAVGNQGFIFN